MSTTLKNELEKLSAARRAKIEARAQELIAEKMTLRDMRKTLNLTQEDLSDKLDINQEVISRLENRSDLLLSTLFAYIAAMGGELTLIAKFPGKEPMHLTGFKKLPHKKIRR